MLFRTRWTPEWDAQLIKMRAEGFSSQDIADAIGNDMTRNAVLGRTFRLGLSPPTKLQKKTPKPRQVASTITGASYLTVSANRVYRTSQPKELPPDEPLAIPGAPVAYLDRRADQCAAIVSDDREPFMCCGHATGLNWHGEPSSYCREHHERYYVKPAKQQHTRAPARAWA
jgi:hypothetical protein